MPGRLAIDFGTSNTVAALYAPAAQAGRSLALAGLTRAGGLNGDEHHLVPSLVHYADTTRIVVGRQVLDQGLRHTLPGTFQWMKTYVGNRLPLPRRIGERHIDFFQAGADFLRQVLIAAGAFVDFAEEEVAFTVPVEAFEHYQLWLEEVVRSAGVQRPRYIDEASAAALGYAARFKAGAPFLVFDFGGGTVDVSIVRIEDDRGQPRGRSLGKAGAQVGGGVLDQWLVRDALARAGRDAAGARGFMPLLLAEAERVKESLSTADAEDFSVLDPGTGAVVHHRYSRGAFEDLLEANGLYTKLHAVLETAEAQAREHGHTREAFGAALMTGGSSLIPSIRRLVRSRYGEITHSERPFDAIAIGAAAFVAGAGFDDRIRHEYALRPYDPGRRDYVFRTIVPAGTPYPCEIMHPERTCEPLVLTIKATNEQQTRFGLQVWEISHRDSVSCGGGGFDLVFDQNGAARLTGREDAEDSTRRPLGSPHALAADPPAKKGDPRFQATFSIDARKYLCTTVKDLEIGKTVLRDFPLVKLT